MLWPHWVAAMGRRRARTSASTAVNPTGLNQRSGARGIGLVQADRRRAASPTPTTSCRAADAIWLEASRYYLVGYWPGPGKRELHSVEVSVARKDLHLRVRRRRGE